jgi:hypothetical protein
VLSPKLCVTYLGGQKLNGADVRHMRIDGDGHGSPLIGAIAGWRNNSLKPQVNGHRAIRFVIVFIV